MAALYLGKVSIIMLKVPRVMFLFGTYVCIYIYIYIYIYILLSIHLH